MEHRRRRSPNRLFVLLLLLLLSSGPCAFSAEPDTVTSIPMVTKSFPVPSDWMLLGKPATNPKSPGTPTPADPFAPVDPFNVEAAKKITDDSPRGLSGWKSSKAILEADGIPFPSGSSALFDPSTRLLTVTNIPLHLEMVEAFVDVLWMEKPVSLSLSLQMIQVPLATALEVTKAVSRKANHRQELTRLMTSQDPQVKPIGTIYLATSSGQKSVAEAALDYEYISGEDENEKTGVKGTITSHPVGLRLESDVVLGPDGKLIDASVQLDFDTALPKEDAPAARHQAPEFRSVLAQTAVTLSTGESRLLGVWQPIGAKAGEGARWLAFLTADKLSHVEAPPYVSGDLKGIKPAKGLVLYESPAPFFFVVGKVPQLLAHQYPDKMPPQFTSEELGIGFPKGSFVKEGPHGQCIVSNLPANIELIAGILEEPKNRVPKRLAITVHALQASGKVVREAIAKAADPHQRRAALDSLLAKAVSGEAAVLGSLQLIAKSGQNSVVSSAEEHATLADFHIGKQGHGTLHSISKPLGFTLEVDPVLQADRSIVDLTLKYQHTRPPGQPRQDKLTSDHGTYAASVEAIPTVQLATSTTIACDSTLLLGAWPVVDPSGEPGTSDLLEVAFISCDAVPLVIGAPETLVGQNAVPRDEAPGDPNKLLTRSFLVPPDFLSLGPVSSGPSARLPTAKEILESQGIPFPPGASAFFSPKTSKLQVTNTLPNLDLVETFSDWRGGCMPGVLNYTFHLIEAPGVLAREIMRENSVQPDAAPRLQRLLNEARQGKARVVDIWFGVTKSGQKTTIQQGAPHQPVAGSSSSNKSAEKRYETSQKLGTTIEWDSVIGPDGRTLDINLSFEHHLAPASSRTLSVGHPGAGGRSDLPVLDYHVSRTVSNFAMMSGMTVLAAAWKPEAAATDLMQLLFVTADDPRNEAKKEDEAADPSPKKR